MSRFILGILIVILATTVAYDHSNKFPFVPYWMKNCPLTGNHAVDCVITVKEGQALTFDLVNGSIGAIGDEGGRLPGDPETFGVNAFGPGKYHIDLDEGAWAVIPLDWAITLTQP